MYRVIPFIYRKLYSLFQKIKKSLIMNELKNVCTTLPKAAFFETTKIINASKDKKKICIGYNSQIYGEIMTQSKEGIIIIGDYCFIGPGTRIWAKNKITIGNRVLIAHNVNILDSNSHSMSAEQRHREFLSCFPVNNNNNKYCYQEDIPSALIIIEDDVWVGFGVTILKGVTIGCGAIIGASSVVTKDVEPYSIVAGNPLRKIGSSKP